MANDSASPGLTLRIEVRPSLLPRYLTWRRYHGLLGRASDENEGAIAPVYITPGTHQPT
ncbi:hypothetical protein DPMN_163943 [Dreissena polymorpha]|uniref:Uncharacterized protein n=1 Tax=Dreissena polymorpha TaxID=45954 RepID=A0A9D4EUX2_DREPO|nr:hypothetical protein DPMN_163943 [Dreissena polymorpha]